MKDFNLTEIFCEILGGFFAILVCALILDCFGYLEIEKFIPDLKTEVSILALLLSSYFLGLIVDAIGLAIGEMFFDNWVVKNDKAPSEANNKAFYSGATESTLRYRDFQWAFYSLYRNILIFSAIGITFYIIKVWKINGGIFAVSSGIIILGVLYCIFRAMRTLLKLYYEIGKSKS